MKRIQLPVADVIAHWKNGLSTLEIGKIYGVSNVPVLRILHSNGVDLKRKLCDPQEVIRLHVDEQMSVKAIADRLGISRGPVRSMLEQNNIAPRNRSESMYIRMSKTGENERKRLTHNAHIAMKGSKRPRHERIKRAKTRSERTKLSKIESVFAEAFVECGVDVIAQLAFDIYICDFAIPNLKLDIEIDPGSWHSTKTSQDQERDAFFTSKGWRVLRWTGDKIRAANPYLKKHAIKLIQRDLNLLLGKPHAEQERK